MTHFDFYTFDTHSSWEEPKEHVGVKGRVDGDQTSVARDSSGKIGDNRKNSQVRKLLLNRSSY